MRVLAFGRPSPGFRSVGPVASYGLEVHKREYGKGTNALRTERAVQPRALTDRDILINGERGVTPDEGCNSRLYVILGGYWVDVPARIPIALLVDGALPNTSSRGETFALAEALQEGDVLVTGDRILSSPEIDEEQRVVELHITGGFDGHWIRVPFRLPVALLTSEDEAVLGKEWLAKYQRLPIRTA